MRSNLHGIVSPWNIGSRDSSEDIDFHSSRNFAYATNYFISISYGEVQLIFCLALPRSQEIYPVTNHIFSKSLAAFALVLMTSAATNSFALSAPNHLSAHSLSAGQIGGGGNPNPTGGGDGGNLAM
jgi:hypothetical protein